MVPIQSLRLGSSRTKRVMGAWRSPLKGRKGKEGSNSSSLKVFGKNARGKTNAEGTRGSPDFS